MSKFKTQEELDIRSYELQAMDNNALVDCVCDLYWHFKESKKRLASDANDVYSEYALARSILNSRFVKY